MEEAVRIALATRLDLKNARAQVMDARRRVEVAANRLQAILNLRVEGDVGTRPGSDNPLDFRAKNSNIRLGVAFTAPLDLIAQRNAYRTAQVNYQRARRAYMALEDFIKLSVRNQWRVLTVQRQNFETLRVAVRVAATQFDNAVEEASAPPVPGQQVRETSSAGLSLLNALNSVLDSQLGLISTWVNYEQNRLNIFRDMGMMDIDARGLWTDPFYQTGPEAAPTTGLPPAPSALMPTAPASGRPDDLRISHANHGNVAGPFPGNVGPALHQRLQRTGPGVPPGKVGKVRLVQRGEENRAAADSGGDRRRRDFLLQRHP
jgi:hypothetical protein